LARDLNQTKEAEKKIVPVEKHSVDESTQTYDKEAEPKSKVTKTPEVESKHQKCDKKKEDCKSK
jgi:hypothetical protein